MELRTESFLLSGIIFTLLSLFCKQQMQLTHYAIPAFLHPLHERFHCLPQRRPEQKTVWGDMS
jgi:hypothetical protein